MAVDRRAIIGTLKQYVPIGVKRRVRRALPERYRRLWDPDWHRGTVRGTKAFWDELGKLQLEGPQPPLEAVDAIVRAHAVVFGIRP